MAYQSKYTGLEIDDILDSVEWKQGKIEDLASIRAGAQKGATALQSYTEKYTGTVTGIKLNGVVKSGSGVIDLGTISTTETDPIFSASPAASITEAKKAEWDGKQDKIADLASIRSGAEKGATALQSIPSEYVTETELTNKGYATTSSLNNKVDKVNGKQLSTEDFTTALKTKLEGLNNYDDTELSNAVETLRGDFDEIVSGDTTTAIKTFNEVIAFLDGITDTQDLESIIASIEQQIAGKMDKVTLATVATSGSYNDLSNKPTIPTTISQLDNDVEYITHEDVATVARTGSYNDLTNKPTIPSAVTESTVSGWGFTKNTGTYSKPSTGIPKTDLASAVQTSLGKADTAVQPAAISDFIKGVAINGTAIANTSGTVYLPNASTGGYGVTRLNSNINSTSTMEAATPSAVKAAYDLANGKQDKLVSGTNIKTINGTSILGSGNIEISGGGSSSGSGAYSEVNHGTSDTTFTLTPNTFHVWDEVSSLTLDLGSETSGVANEFLFQFNSGSTATSLTLPDDIKWANDSAPTIAENMIYQVSILKGLASVLEFDNTPAITLINFTVDSTSFDAESGMLWSEWVVSNYNTSGYISIAQNKVINMYTQGNLFTISGVTVNSSDVVQPIKYTFTNPWS